MQTKTKIAGAVFTGLALTGVGIGAAATAFADPSATPTPGTSAGQSGTPGDKQGRMGDRDGQLAQQLAQKLGVDQTKVSDALRSVHDERKPSGTATPGATPSARPDPATRDADLAKSLAEKLGVDEAKVKAALDEIRTAADAQRTADFKAKLDQAVKDGKLTQAEADAVQKAADAGVIPNCGKGR
ncbi:hypothetical protein CGZ93_06275 [Enemella dayhoffiae]|uniref:Uncharacterized protein n=1 Tax=Enemella dayhoffiae TaxID=2016507 RepID=A0A255H677_9ACTN|nr:hypothetical protein [Enemella dayhoffiae]OYO23067.1 hypothetical protein CGZ93_06275 [Enemella dayhoffiae]